MKIINLSFKGMKLKLYRIIGLGLLTFLFSVSAMAQEIHYSVYGAGTPNVDGLYWNNDAAFIWNGKLIYVNEAFHGIAGEKFHIGFDGTRWIIGLNRDIWNLPMEEYYRNDDTGDIPPATGWYVYGSGTDPAPTVTSVPMWFQSQKIMSTIPTADYFIGQDIDISGDYAIIGNYENDNITANNGAAYLLKINTTTNQWEVNQFIEGNGSSVSCFGAGVAINATHYYISAPYNGPNTVGDFTVFGTVWESSLPTWGGQTLSYVSSSSILSSMGMLTRYFGEVVVADDEWVAVSVEGEEIHESEFGPIHQTNAVHIYSVGNFLQRKYAMPADYVNYPFSEDEGFGSAIAIDNDVLVVGAYLHDEDENGLNTLNDAGAVYIFAPPTSGEQWTQMQKIVPSDRAANDQFGISVGISGDYIFVGAPGAVEMGGNKIGAVYVFKNNGGTWVEEQKILKPEYLTGDAGFGRSIDMDGNYAILGSGKATEIYSHAPVGGTGTAYLYENKSGHWTMVDEMAANNGNLDDFFATGRTQTVIFGNDIYKSVAISGDKILIGAYGNDYDQFGNYMNNMGAVYYFNQEAPDIDVMVYDNFSNKVYITNGDNTPTTADKTDFEEVSVGSAKSYTYYIENNGNVDIILENIIISGSTAFTVTDQPESPVIPGAFTTFEVTYTPTSTGRVSGIVSIPNSTFSENPFTFTVKGGIEPEITILYGSTEIINGDASPSTGEGTDFGLVSLSNPLTRTFTIKNDGTKELTLGTAGVTGNAAFTIAAQPASPVAPGASTTVQVQFQPVSLALVSATFSITSDDADESPYTFSMQGSGSPLIGSGTVADPYLISSLSDLSFVAQKSELWNKVFLQTVDIDASQTQYWDDTDDNGDGDLYNDPNDATASGNNEGFSPIGNPSIAFTGTYKAGGNNIDNMTIDRPFASYIALFGNTSNATIEYIGLNNANVTGQFYTGTLIGYAGTSNVSNCYATGGVDGEFTIGGFLGYCRNSTVTDCYSRTSVTRTSGTNTQIGSFIGYNSSSTISNSYATGDVSCGGATNKGFIGYNVGGTYSNNFFDNEAYNQTTATGASGQTTTNMTTQNTYSNAGWDFDINWDIDGAINDGYPTLREPYMFPAGDGSTENPYQITTLSDLRFLSENSAYWTSHFIQTADIDASASSGWNSGAGFSPIGNSTNKFTGSYNGQDHSITSLSINRPVQDYTGLFGFTDHATLDNIIVSDVGISANNFVGGLAGYSNYTTITNCHVSGTVTGSGSIAGMAIGYNNYGTNTECSSSGTVNGANYVGGYAGRSTYTTINGCFSTADVNATNNGGAFIGNNDGPVTNCYSRGNVTRTSGTSNYFGSFMGYNSDPVSYCYSTGSVFQSPGVAWSDGSKGFIGYNSGGTYLSNFFDADASNQNTATGATAKTTLQMTSQDTFTGAGWDFLGETTNGTNDYWAILADYNNGYPNLDGATTFIWTGTTSTAWETGSNWDKGAVPGDNAVVIIPNVSGASNNNPVVAVGVGASTDDLTLEPGSILTINSGGSLITNGTLTNNGTIDVKRTITEETWHLVSIPTVTANANIFLGDYLQGWDESDALWSEIIPAITPLAPVKGYALWATPPPGKSDFTYTFSGTPNTGSQSLTFTAEKQYGWNLMGNPYPSYLDWDAVIADQTKMNGGVYCYNGSTYVSYNDGIGGGSRYIAPMQGFFISATDDGTFILNNSHRTHTSEPYFKEKEIPDHYLRLTTNGNSITDDLHIRFNESATPDFDGQFDAWKLLSWNEQAPQLYSFSVNDILSIDQRPACESIQLGFFTTKNGVYSIAVNVITDLSSATLEDTKTNTFHNLQNGPYDFAWEVADDEKRFKLHLNAVGIEETPITPIAIGESDILIYAANGQIFIKGTENGQVVISDMMGRVVLQQEIRGDKTITIPANLQTGVYLVTVQNGMEVKTEKVFIK